MNTEIISKTEEEILNFIKPIDFKTYKFNQDKDKILSIVKKINIYTLLTTNKTLIIYLIYNTYIKEIVKENDALKLLDYYKDDIDMVLKLLPLASDKEKVLFLKRNKFKKEQLDKIARTTNNSVLNYLFYENNVFTSLNGFDFYFLKFLISTNCNIPNSYLYEKKFIKRISRVSNIKNYRLFMLEFNKKYDSFYIEKKRKEYYNKEILSYSFETKMLNRFYNFYLEITTSTNLDKDFDKIVNTYFDFFNVADDPLYLELKDICFKKNFSFLKEFLINESNITLTNMIIDYHFEDIPYNFYMDLKRVIKFQDKNKTLTDLDINLYNRILNLDKLDYLEKLKLHEELKKTNMLIKFYDDYNKTKSKSISLIKKSILNEDKIKPYYNYQVSKKLGVDVYVLENIPFYALVKSLTIEKSNILKSNDLISYVDGASYSIDGSLKLKTFYDPRVNYNIIYSNFNEDQVVHIYPVDSYSYYKRGTEYGATTRVFELLTPFELVDFGLDHNEIIIAQHNSRSNDEVNNKLTNPKPLGIYCYDFVTENDIISSKRLNLPIVVVKTKSYKKNSAFGKLNEYEMVGNIYGYRNEYDYITLEREDDMIFRRLKK